MGKMFELTAADGFVLSAYRADPAGSPRGGLVVAQEIFGINSHIRSVCDGFAADGYLAIAPALFDRYQRGFDVGYTPEDIAKGRELKGKAGIDAALKDVGAARDGRGCRRQGRRRRLLLGRVRRVDGGGAAWRASPAPFRTTAAECSRRSASIRTCPVIAHFGERDTGIPVDGVRKFAAAHPEIAGAHLRRGPRLQLRSARLVQRSRGEARARAHAFVPAAARRLIARRAEPGARARPDAGPASPSSRSASASASSIAAHTQSSSSRVTTSGGTTQMPNLSEGT